MYVQDTCVCCGLLLITGSLQRLVMNLFINVIYFVKIPDEGHVDRNVVVNKSLISFA